MYSAIGGLCLVVESQGELIVANSWESIWRDPFGVAIFSLSCLGNDQVPSLDMRLHGTTSSKSNNGLSSKFCELFEANCSSWSTDSMRNDCQIGVLVSHIEETILTIKLNFLEALAKFNNHLTSEGITHSDHSWSNNPRADFQMWSKIIWISYQILLSLGLVGQVLLQFQIQDFLELFIELGQSMSTHFTFINIHRGEVLIIKGPLRFALIDQRGVNLRILTHQWFQLLHLVLSLALESLDR